MQVPKQEEKKEEPEAKTEEKSEETKPEEDKEQEETTEPTPEHLSAIQVLRRGKVPAALIDRLSVEEAVKMANDLKPIQADGDRFTLEHSQLKKELEELKQLTSKKEPELDTSKYTDQLSKVKDDLGDDASSAIAALLAKRDQEQNQTVAKAIENIENRIKQMQIAQYDRELSSARDQLVNDFPRLKNPATYDAVLERTNSLLSTRDAAQRYRGNLTEAMREAAKLEIGVSDRLAGEHQARRESQQDTQQPANQSSVKPLTRDEADWQIFQHIENGRKDLADEVEAKFQRENKIT
jgi:hypothetical protein